MLDVTHYYYYYYYYYYYHYYYTLTIAFTYIQKTSVDFVFLLNAGASIWITALFAIDVSNPTSNDNILVVLSWLQIAAISIAISFHVSLAML